MSLSGLQAVRLMRRKENIEKENDSLIQKNRFLKKGLVGLSILSVLSIGSCWKNANALNQERSEHTALRATVSHFQSDAARLAFENQELKNYADDAQNFALGIRPLLDENDFGCEDPNCTKCKKMEKENDKELDEFSKAMNTLNLDQKVLFRLQEGWQRQ